MVTDNEEAEVLIDQCESGFEREVFSILASRGYRVIPQVKTGAYRIDMVVEGVGNNRLAIELDGDEYHGPDRWPHDMNRQRVLERAGWVFWRCFASAWSLHKDDVLQELLARLTAMGIEPMGGTSSLAAIHYDYELPARSHQRQNELPTDYRMKARRKPTKLLRQPAVLK